MSAADWEAEITVTYRHSLAKRRKHDEDVIKRAMESGYAYEPTPYPEFTHGTISQAPMDISLNDLLGLVRADDGDTRLDAVTIVIRRKVPS